MIFTPTIIQNAEPEVAVTVADSGVPSVTYNQIKQSLGTYVYNVDEIYLFSTIKNQLIGVFKYNRYDINGSQDIRNVVTTIDPYQLESSLYKDLSKENFSFILNGNSSVSTTILPNAYLQLKLFTRRITSGMGMNISNFDEMERIFKKDFYEYRLGYSIDGDAWVFKNLPPHVQEKVLDALGKPIKIENEPPEQKDNEALALMSLAAFSIGFYLIFKNE
jgi:hypothetical protein